MTPLTNTEIKMLIDLCNEEIPRLPKSPVSDILKQTFNIIITKLKDLLKEK